MRRWRSARFLRSRRVGDDVREDGVGVEHADRGRLRQMPVRVEPGQRVLRSLGIGVQNRDQPVALDDRDTGELRRARHTQLRKGRTVHHPRCGPS